MRLFKKQLVKLSKKHPVLRRLRNRYVSIRNKVLWQAYKRNSVESKTVIFEAYMGRSYSCSPKAIYEYMLSSPEYEDYKFIWAFKRPNKYGWLLENPRTSIVKQRSIKYYKAYSRTQFWVVNSMLPFLITKKPNQTMLQCWHGTPLKRLRNDLPKNYKAALNTYKEMVEKNNQDTVRYDYMISPSRFATDKFTSAFSLKSLGKQDIIIETGYPRNDFLYNYKQQDINEIKSQLSIPKDKKVLLYAPTWRDNQHESGTGYTYKTEADFDYLQKYLDKEWVILFRAHYFVVNSFDFSKYEGFVYDVSKVDDVNDLYIVSDVLMTDYSSVFFDYANLRRPMIFFMYDLDYYKDDLRGFYIDVKTLPGDIVKTEKEIVGTIKDLSAYSKKHASSYKKFNNTYNYLDDGNAAKRATGHLLGNNGS